MSEHCVRHVPPLHAPPVPRAREDVAAIRAVSFAATDHAAGALLAVTVQQRLTTPEWLSTASQMHPTLRRRRAIAGFIRDIGGGSQSIDELAFVAHPRRRRSPLPDRQVVRQGPDGGWYLDARWNADGRVAEIDGAHHQGGANPITDALRQNAVALHGDRVLRVPDIGLRSDPDAFLDQIEAALIDAGVVEVRAP